MKLWQKASDLNHLVEAFTVGEDRDLDLQLAEFDVLGSLAHARMLEKVGLLTTAEHEKLRESLIAIYHDIQKGEFKISPDVEDIHSQVELQLTKSLGETGKKIHTARSRNDQVLLDLRLFIRDRLESIAHEIDALTDQLLALSNRHKDVFLPGYTHLQVAMPSSFGLWFGAYAESLADDLEMILAAFKLSNKNPLGSAAGYGTSLPIDRSLTTELLGFDSLNTNVVYAQMGRGKTELNVSAALSSVAMTLNKFAGDVCLYMNQNFNFLTFPEELTTGSSIMPHKKNPDVFELIRGKTNLLKSLHNEVHLLTTNLPSGYFRDFQMIKTRFLPAFTVLHQCLQVTRLMLENVKVNEHIGESDIYKYIYSVETVNQQVMEGKPFRDAYRQVGEQIERGNFSRPENVQYTHEGSIGNLGNEAIARQKARMLSQFPFEKIKARLKKLLGAQ